MRIKIAKDSAGKMFIVYTHNAGEAWQEVNIGQRGTLGAVDLKSQYNVFNKHVQTYAVVIPCMNLIICGLLVSCMDTIQKVVSFVFIFLNISIIKNNYQVIIFRCSNDVMKRHLKHLNDYFV